MESQTNGNPNPFSFKTFLKRGEGGTGDKNGTKAPARTNSKKRKSDKKNDPFPEDQEGARKSDNENPFSFTKFVERKSSNKPHPFPKSTTQTSSSSDSDMDSSLTVVEQPPLPTPPSTSLPTDQQKTTLKTKPTKSTKSSKSSLTASPPQQKAKKTSNPKTKAMAKRPKEKKKEPTISIFDKSDEDDANDRGSTVLPPAPPPVAQGVASEIMLSRRRPSGSSLETPSSSSNSPDSPRRGLGVGLGGTIVGDIEGFGDTVELKKLRAENDRLQRELALSQETLKKQVEKNKALKSSIKALKKKEAEDTKALEDIVQKVESNLVATTKRATNAENIIVKLKQEVASLQAQLAKSTPQAVHQHYEETLRGVREKSTFASQQLSTAAQMADKSIRDLLSGVDTLKNVAEILQFIDRITEVRTSSTDSGTT